MKHTSPAILSLIIGFSVSFSGACRSNRSSETGKEAVAGSIETFMPAQVRVVFRRSCETCHGPDGRGITGVAPDIQRAQPRSFEAWTHYLRNPHQAHPDATTPPVWLSEAEIKAVATFLARLHPDEQAPIETPAAR